MYDPEAIYQDADIEMAEFEAEGNRLYRRKQLARKLHAAGDDEGAAEMCPHGGGYPLDSLAARRESDPFAGEAGWRCLDCGSRLGVAPWDGGGVIVPCEVP